MGRTVLSRSDNEKYTTEFFVFRGAFYINHLNKRSNTRFGTRLNEDYLRVILKTIEAQGGNADFVLPDITYPVNEFAKLLNDFASSSDIQPGTTVGEVEERNE